MLQLAKSNACRLWLAAAFITYTTLLLSCDATQLTENRQPDLRAKPPQHVVEPGQSAHFFVHAHADDWQLFMGDKAQSSLQAANSVVFVYATAGDAGYGTSFWQAREAAAQVAIDSLIGAGGWSCAPQTIAGHAIRRCEKGKTVSYYMRLPDGGTSGEGIDGHGSLA
ncbi:MAG: hypothetical protein ABI681_14420, partial [Gemmatimonadales bacterium]